MSPLRKHLAPAQKLAILREYLVARVPISDLCDRHGLQPSQIYYWQNQLFEQGARVFERSAEARGEAKAQHATQRIITRLQEKLVSKNEVLAELMEEHVKLKKELGDP